MASPHFSHLGAPSRTRLIPQREAVSAAARTLPLLPAHLRGRTIAYDNEKAISAEQFLADVMALAQTLPHAGHALNLCEGRYAFAVAFAAIVARGQCNILPHTRVAGSCNQIAADYPGSYALVDRPSPELARLVIPVHEARPAGAAAGSFDGPMPQVDAAQVAAIAFTSGSTGKPQANRKPWSALVTGAQLASEQFALDQLGKHCIVATVPPQHMYGLETSIMLPLARGGAFHAARPLFPADIVRTLAAVNEPRVLVTTPVHLRTCVESGMKWPEVALVISATAPLPRELAARVEKAMSTQVCEIFGFSEAGSIASRRTVADDSWRLYRGLGFEAGADGELLVHGGHVPAPVPLADQLEIEADGRFRLVGRHSDRVNVAGKRVALGELNALLADIEGVVEGVFVLPDGEPSRGDAKPAGVIRLAALVVAPTLSKAALAAAIAERVDPAFRPRPLRMVSALPRNSIGKLLRKPLLDLLAAPDFRGP